jgi:hypothetical protein
MSSIGENNKQSVVKMVQEILQRQTDKSMITLDMISSNVEMVLLMMPDWKIDLNYDAVSDELIRRFSIWIGQNSSLVNNEGHVTWLKAERKQNWRYWQRYREWQENQLPWSAVDSLDISTDEILGLLEDPEREGAWDRRGLVVGHVQSGKTGNYTGLICKAADAGYKIIIVLAGMHNNLRSQTQMRLDEGFLGYETSPLHGDNLHVIGVGEIDSDHSIRPNYATNRADNGDFTTKIAKNLGISPEQRPWLFVVKKNKTVLSRLHKWINNHVADSTDPESGIKVVTKLPLLIIDDEADNASVDTGEQRFNEEGTPDEDHQPTAINSLIRKILHSFQRKAYVGYTATPFANIFIHERGATAEEGSDLFPSAFIINLAAPSNYIGPARVFGFSSMDKQQDGLPLIKTIDDHCTNDCKMGWMPLKHKSNHKPQYPSEHSMPDSLRDAIDSFILVCAIRNLRGQQDQHSSMLVHVTRFTAVQKDVYKQVEAYIRLIKQRLHRKIDHKLILVRLELLWKNEFLPTTNRMQQEWPDLVKVSPMRWQEIEEVLPNVLNEISVRMINGSAKDALDYADSAGGLKVIAIGGDKLARGLTLEGLCISYFLRASRMYDTLMQMGRWFGYRPDYLDLCRLYTTSDLIDWFKHIAEASEELREEFDTMAANGSTPKQYGLKVKSHPVLMVTSQLKMRASKNLWLSFSGSVVETVSFFKDHKVLMKNFKAFTDLVGSLPMPQAIPDQIRNGNKNSWNGVCWNNVSHDYVTNFLESYKTHEAASKVNSQILSEFIATMAKIGELTEWTIAVIGGGLANNPWKIGSYSVKKMERAGKEGITDRYAIGRLLSPRDEAININEDAWLAALSETIKAWRGDPGRLAEKNEPPTVPNGVSIRLVNGFGLGNVPPHPERGLLLLYLLEPQAAYKKSSDLKFPDDTPPIVSFGISFPTSVSGAKVEYKVNNVLWEQEYGASE